MGTAFPRLEAYLAGLPSGLDSYLQAEHKASVYHAFFDDTHSLAQHAARLPGPLQDIIARPPPINTWMPECRATALYMALADAHFPDDDAFIAYAYRRNKALISSVAYRVLFKVLRPQAVLAGAASRWERFHRGGVELTSEPRGQSDVALVVSYPAGLVTELLARAYTTAFRGAVEVAGGKHVRFELEEVTDTHARFRGSWT